MRGRRRAAAWSASRRSRPQPKPIPGDPEHALASMGIYVFTARFLFEQLCLDATRHGSQHDFGRDIIPVGHPHAPRVRLSVPRREPQAGRLLARRGHAGRLLRGQHGPDLGRSAVEHVRRSTGRSAPISRTIRRRSSSLPSRAKRPAAARPWTASSARARIISGGQVERIDPRAQRARSTAMPTSKTRSCSRASNIGRHAKIRRAIIDKGVRHPARHRDRLRPRAWTAAAASPSPKGA